jgi:hypothetical protein
MKIPQHSSRFHHKLRRILPAGFCFAAAFSLLAVAAVGQQKGPAKAISSRAVNFAESIPARDLPPLDPKKENNAGREINLENREQIRQVNPNEKPTRDGALSSDMTDGNAPQPRALPTPTVNFEGISLTDTVAVGQGFLPPDTNGAVGPNPLQATHL